MRRPQVQLWGGDIGKGGGGGGVMPTEDEFEDESQEIIFPRVKGSRMLQQNKLWLTFKNKKAGWGRVGLGRAVLHQNFVFSFFVKTSS